MGSWFSSPAAGDRSRKTLSSLYPRRRRLGPRLPKELLASLDTRHDVPEVTIEEICAECICKLAHRALKHYNDDNPGAEFEYPAQSTTEMKAACTGFREEFLWYHLGFSARRMDNQEMHLFFAELSYDLDSYKMTVETCTILEEPLCRFRTSCAFCPEKSKIMHPSEQEFVCGKEGQRTQFFRVRQMLTRPFDDEDNDLEDGPTMHDSTNLML